MESTGIPHYPTIQFIVNHGNKFAVLLPIIVFALGAYLAWMQSSGLYAIASVIVSAILYVIAKSYVELVQIISDMLLPK